jgi:1-acyl-sn-glycerol-3-phosphate acyltransferase
VEAPLLVDEPRRTRFVRRVRGIALLLAAFLLVSVLLVPLLVVAGVIDVVRWRRLRKRFVAVRLLALLWWVTLGELLGLVGLLRIWLRATIAGPAEHPYPYRQRLYRLRQRWLARHLAGLRVLLGLRLEVDGLELAGPGPVVILMRHTSTLDPLLPDVIVGRPLRLGLRVVAMRELVNLPTIDIGLRFAPHLLVSRRSAPGVDELDRLRELPRDLGADEGVLIFPEGMIYSPDRLARAKRAFARRRPELAPLIERMRHVLPPRLGGAIALLQSCPGADVVLCGHMGLAPLASVWRGGLIGNTVRVKFWRYPAEDVPTDSDEALVPWLFERWIELDDWIDQQLTQTATPEPLAELARAAGIGEVGVAGQ